VLDQIAEVPSSGIIEAAADIKADQQDIEQQDRECSSGSSNQQGEY
jgi:hypothetical protein